MSLNDICQETNNSYYLPHHGVLKEDRETTKLCAEFDASAQTSSGVSLIDLQMVSPVHQEDRFSRFRKHRFMVSADMVRYFQNTTRKQNQCKCITSTPWGMAPAASFLAIRCLATIGCRMCTRWTTTFLYCHPWFLCWWFANRLGFCLWNICNEVFNIFKTRLFWTKKVVIKRTIDFKESSSGGLVVKNLRPQFWMQCKTFGIFWSCHSDRLMYETRSKPEMQSVTKLRKHVTQNACVAYKKENLTSTNTFVSMNLRCWKILLQTLETYFNSVQ